MRTSLVVPLVSIAAVGCTLGIAGVFGILPAVAALLLFVAFACVQAVPSQRSGYTQVQWRSGRKRLNLDPMA